MQQNPEFENEPAQMAWASSGRQMIFARNAHVKRRANKDIPNLDVAKRRQGARSSFDAKLVAVTAEFMADVVDVVRHDLESREGVVHEPASSPVAVRYYGNRLPPYREQRKRMLRQFETE